MQQLETLELILKNNVAGVFGGNHQSRSFGSSCEFADYRDYIPGDDITKIDWNAYARFEHLYLKQYLDERRLHTKIYLDASRSMDYNKSNKAVKALQVAAAFAYLSVVMMDKVSIYYIKDDYVYDLALNIANKDQFFNNIQKLNEIDFDGDFNFSEAVLPTNVGYGDGISIVVSDFLTENDFERGIDYLISKNVMYYAVRFLQVMKCDQCLMERYIYLILKMRLMIIGKTLIRMYLMLIELL